MVTKLASFASLVCILLSLTACQTPSHKHFTDVRVGMDKPTVLELIGGPQKASRIAGRDRWIYIFRSATEGEMIREIHFEHGRVLYVGGRVSPDVPAEDQDRMNEKLVQDDSVREEAEKAQWDKEHGVLRLPKKAGPAKLDDHDMRLKDSMLGTDFYKKAQREKNKVAPTFEAVD